MNDQKLNQIFGAGQSRPTSDSSSQMKIVTSCAIVSVFVCCFSFFLSVSNQQKTEALLKSAESLIEKLESEADKPGPKINRQKFRHSTYDKDA